jgi:hypothetical protein
MGIRVGVLSGDVVFCVAQKTRSKYDFTFARRVFALVYDMSGDVVFFVLHNI